MSRVLGRITGTSDTKRGLEASERYGKIGAEGLRGYTERAVSGLEPYREAGKSALENYRDIVLGGDASKFRTTPGYEFRLGEGVKALERGASARGGLLSGAQQKALTRYGQDIGSQEYQNYLSQLAGLMGQGYGASTTSGGYLTGAGSNLANLYGNIGQQQLAGYGMLGQQKGQFMGNLLGAGATGLGAYAALK